MAQDEVLKWFKSRAESGRNEWLTFTDARKKMREDGIDIQPSKFNKQMRSLAKYNFIEQKQDSWRCEFRYPVRE